MSEHTPGPWKVGRDMFGAVHVYDSGGDRLTNDRMCGTAGWEQKARLIAAAPELLEALEDAVNALINEGRRGGLVMGRARDAIAKAKGQSND